MDEMETSISWENISSILNYHVSVNGFKYVDVPWIIPKCIKSITFNCQDWNVLENNLCLIGSGEQGFIYCQVNEALEPERCYITSTPCFRNEENLSDIRKLYFMKCELFKSLKEGDDYDKALEEIICAAENGLNQLIHNRKSIYRMKTEEGIDLMIDDVEIGSYYFREYKFNDKKFRYVCGTAIAEPRFSSVLNSSSNF